MQEQQGRFLWIGHGRDTSARSLLVVVSLSRLHV